MSENLTFSRPPNPVFNSIKRMTKRDHRALAKWHGWLLVLLASLHDHGAWDQPEPRNILGKVENILCAVDAGAKKAVIHSDALHARLLQMPPVPAVWPDEYPFALAWHFLEYLRELLAAQPDTVDCPPPLE